MKELVSKELVQEIVERIQSCNWSCQEEIECYMHSAINNTEEYDPENWEVSLEKWLEAKND